MAGRFQVGDRVKQVTGGPVMHVKESTGGKVVCSWYVANQGWSRDSFAVKGLKRVGKSRSSLSEAIAPVVPAAPTRGRGRPPKASSGR